MYVECVIVLFHNDNSNQLIMTYEKLKLNGKRFSLIVRIKLARYLGTMGEFEYLLFFLIQYRLQIS